MEDWSSISHLYIWPESDRLKQVDESSRSLVYTIPIIKSDQQLVDEIPETVEKIRGYKFSRKSVSPDVNGLKALIKEGNLKSAFNLTTAIFKSLGYGSTTDKRPAVTFDIWNCRFQLLMALKLHRLAVDEMSAFEELDAPDLYFQYYAENRARGLSGTIVPFNLRLIHAEILQYTPTPWNSWNRLSKLEENVKSILDVSDLQTHVRNVWNQRLEAVKLAQGRLLFSLKCMSFYKEIAMNTPDQQRAKHLRRFLVRLSMVMGNSGAIDELAECEDFDPKWTK
ncbi:hypothetical protein M3Y96_00081800 [Aphelenchoides besseyi]|nr:hypothetical protein M3Y96_00081800 [Aphelenchoides besseyi]